MNSPKIGQLKQSLKCLFISLQYWYKDELLLVDRLHVSVLAEVSIMAHYKLFDEIVQELLSVLFDGACYFKDGHASRNHSNIICMAWEWIQGQTRRLKLKTIDHEKSFFRNTSQAALEVVELAFDERSL